MVKHFKNSRGVTLTELMVAVAIMSIGILGFFGAFRFITMSLHVSRARTLATNLAQEKVEALKNYSYYQLLITTASSVDNSLTPGVVYDNSNYPPETISIGGITFTRYTFVALAQIDTGSISTVTYTFPDTGMKQVTVNIVWSQSGTKRKYTLTNLLENPNVAPLDSGLTGSVVFQSGTAFPGAIVKTEQNPDYNTTSASDGSYSFRVYHGSYTVRASSAGYYDAVTTLQNVPAGTNVTAPSLVMQAIGSGTISGIAWMNTDLVISQVVVSTTQSGYNEYGTDYNGFQAMYVELFNPTTFAINIGDSSAAAIKIKTRMPSGCTNATTCDDATYGLKMTYISTYVAAGKYYLAANTGTFVSGGLIRHADAVIADDANTLCSPAPTGSMWNTGSSPPIKLPFNPGHGGSVRIERTGSGIVDKVGWSHNANTPIYYEGAYIPLGAGGLSDGYQLVRLSSPTATLVEANQVNYGRAYDSNFNDEDWLYPPTAFTWVAPKTSADTAATILTGKPAVGANVNASDPYSGSTIATAGYIVNGSQTLLYAPFKLVGVGTSPVAASCAGTCWDLVVATNGYSYTISTISVTQGVVSSVPNATTVPTWTVANHIGLQLTTATVGGYVSGRISDLSNANVPSIQVVAGGFPKTTGTNGVYFIATASGSVTITANPNNANGQYVQGIQTVNVQSGQITQADFILSKGGSIQGYITSGTTPLPNYVVAATIGGSQYGSGSSNTSGYFTIRNLSTGTYTIAPTLDPGTDSQPNSVSVTLTNAGTTVFAATFTVSGALGSIAGTVSVNSQLLTSGALLLASTATIASTPTSIAASSAPALTPIYAVSSKADGHFDLPVRGNATYYLSAYVPSISNSGTVTITTKTYSSIYVTPTVTTTRNVTIP